MFAPGGCGRAGGDLGRRRARRSTAASLARAPPARLRPRQPDPLGGLAPVPGAHRRPGDRPRPARVGLLRAPRAASTTRCTASPRFSGAASTGSGSSDTLARRPRLGRGGADRALSAARTRYERLVVDQRRAAAARLPLALDRALLLAGAGGRRARERSTATTPGAAAALRARRSPRPGPLPDEFIEMTLRALARRGTLARSRWRSTAPPTPSASPRPGERPRTGSSARRSCSGARRPATCRCASAARTPSGSPMRS